MKESVLRARVSDDLKASFCEQAARCGLTEGAALRALAEIYAVGAKPPIQRGGRMKNLIFIKNDGPEIIETNYWNTPNATAGYFYLTINAGAFRLLVPESQLPLLDEFATGKEVVVSRGPWPSEGRPDAIEILFDDGSETPYALHIVPEQCDRIPGNDDTDKQLVFSVWTAAGKMLELPCYFRTVVSLPCMDRYTGVR